MSWLVKWINDVINECTINAFIIQNKFMNKLVLTEQISVWCNCELIELINEQMNE